MLTGNSEQQDRQKGSEEPMASNSASSNVNHGIEAGQVAVLGSVTINHYHGIQSPQRQADDSPASSSNTQTPSQRTDMNSPDAVQQTSTARTVGVSNPKSTSNNSDTLPPFIRSSTPMPLTDNDWERLKQLQKRLKVDTAGRKNMLFNIVGQRSSDDPFAAIIAIPGDTQFFEALDNLWRTIEDNNLIEKYIQTLKPLTINGSDQEWIGELLERLGRVPPPPKETDILSNAVSGILKRNPLLGKRLLEAIPHVDLMGLPPGIQTHEELVTQFLTHDFPLVCLRGTLDACVDRLTRFEDPSTRKDLIVLKDMLTVASFPGDDKEILVGAMQSVWKQAVIREGAELKTSDKSFAEDMLISTWLQVTEQHLQDWEILQLLHRDPNYPINAKERKSVMFRRVQILSQPARQPTGDALVKEYARSCICEATGIPQNPDNPIKVFNDFLEALAKKQAIAALFITKEFQETIEVLKKYFPRLILVVLSTTDADRYSSIYREISFIDNNIDRICRS